MSPISKRRTEAIKTGPLLKIKDSLFWIIPVLALTSEEDISETIPPLLEKKKMSTVKASPIKNMTSIILTEKNEAITYVKSNSTINAIAIVMRNFFLIVPPIKLKNGNLLKYEIVIGKVSNY